jgi:LuxR family maltose regulon positive regulatory protein
VRNRRWQRSGSAGFLKAANAIMLLDMCRLDEALADVGEAIELLDVTRTYAYVGIALSLRAQILIARGDPAAAAADLARARAIGRSQRLERVVFRANLAGARIACGKGAWQEAEQLLAEAHAILEQTGQTRMPLPSENQAMYDAALAALLFVRGRHAELARVGEAGVAVARRAGRTRHEIEFLIWHSLALAGSGADGAALAQAGRAIDLASGAGVIHPFQCAGEAILPLLAPHRSGGLRTTFAAGVAASFERRPQVHAAAQRQPLLHQREVQILKLLGQGLRNREIGARLLVSEETVKWYLKKLFETLGVGNRTHALVRARELGILG